MLALGIRYLTGYAVATDVSDRQKAEWPPHPARVFMAMAAACFETGEDHGETMSLKWLEKQGPPAIAASDKIERAVVQCFVPVNDKAGPSKTMLQSAPGLTRDRKERFFPCVRPDNDTVHFVWPDAQPEPDHIRFLQQLCENVIRVGHSSSLVQMWVEPDPPAPNWELRMDADLQLRVVSEGTFEYLKSQFNTEELNAYADLQERLSSARGKQKTSLKKQLKQQFPAFGLWQGYGAASARHGARPFASGEFGSDLMVLALQDGPTIGLETTCQLLTALRDTILTLCHPTPEWINGHKDDGSPSSKTHLALLPLPFVGQSHADGHLLGVALAFPTAIPLRERGTALRGLFYDSGGRPRPIHLKLGALGDWCLVLETRESPPKALQARTWTSQSRTWATVTPIVLDRHPKADYSRNRLQWFREVAESIEASCCRQGLPKPVSIDIDKTCWHRGAPRAIPGKGGFPLYPSRQGGPARQQVHAWLQFDCDVEGPLLLGAGRYRGYGLCRPWIGGDR